MKRALQALAGIVIAGAAQPAAARSFYHLESATVLPGASPAWDYVTLDPVRPYIFIGRRGAGVTVFDVQRRRIVGAIAQSRLADAATLVAEFDRGYTANEDGSSTVFELSTLRTIGRIAVGTDNDSVFYDPVTKQLMFTQGDSRRLAFVDAASGKARGVLAMDSEKLDGAAPDGEGRMFVAERDHDRIARVDLRTHRLTASWKVAGCTQPTGVAYDAASHRIFVGCRGESPVLAVLDSKSGRVVATRPIGHGNDGVAFDRKTREVYTTNGVDANLVIYCQTSADVYSLVEATTTRPYARTMALDGRRGKVYSVTAEGTADPAKAINAKVSMFYPNTYFDGTFTVLVYTRK